MSEVVSPVILVPGITGSVLHDEYEMPPEAVWTTGVPVRLQPASTIRIAAPAASNGVLGVTGPPRCGPPVFPYVSRRPPRTP